MSEYTLWEQIRLAIPRSVWAFFFIGLMCFLYLGVPFLSFYGLYKLIF